MEERLMPVQKENRLLSIDIIRGFALLGILMVNMAWFKAPTLFALMAPDGVDIPTHDGTMNQIASTLIALLAEGSFYPMFSFLFGLGFFLLMDRAMQKGHKINALYSKRLLILLGFGLIHLIFVWSGDILHLYAVAGFGLLLFKNVSAKATLRWAIGILAVVLIFMALLMMLNEWAMQQEFMQPMLEDEVHNSQRLIDEALVVYATGSYWEVTMFRMVNELPLVAFNLFFSIFAVFGLFLIGVYFGKRRLFENVEHNLSLFRKLWVYSLFFTIVTMGTYFYADSRSENSFLYAGLSEMLFMLFGYLLTFFYVSSIVLLLRVGVWKKVLSVLAPVGQMALTNYLTQSLVCVLLFKGYGFGLFGEVGAAEGVLIAFLIFIIQIFISHWWLKSFKFGPLEWVWRSLTYGKKQPLKRQDV